MRIEDELRQTFTRRAREVEPSNEAWSAIERRLERRLERAQSPSSRLRVVSIALTLFAVVFVGLWVAFGGLRSQGQPASSPRPSQGLRPQVAGIIPVGPFPRALAASEEGAWISVQSDDAESPNLLVHIDSATNAVSTRLEVEDVYSPMAAGFGSIWGIVNRDGSPTLVRLDPDTGREIATVQDVAAPLAVGAGAVWAAIPGDGATDSLVRIDPATNEISATTALPEDVAEIVADGDTLWVLALEAETHDLLRIDATTGTVVAQIDIPGPGVPNRPAVGEGMVWVPIANGGESVVLRVDVETNMVVGDPIPFSGSSAIGVTDGGVWLLDQSGAVHRLNTQTLEYDEPVVYGLPPALAYNQPTATLVVSTSSIWIANYADSVTRIALR